MTKDWLRASVLSIAFCAVLSIANAETTEGERAEAIARDGGSARPDRYAAFDTESLP